MVAQDENLAIRGYTMGRLLIRKSLLVLKISTIEEFSGPRAGIRHV